MEKFVKKPHRCSLLVLLVFCAGCVSLQMPGYISRADHTYTRKIYASFEKATATFIYVLKKKGWRVSEESLPSLYERDERYDNNGWQNLLIITNIKKKNYLIYTTSSHLNVYIHGLGNSCDVEIRYEAQTPFVKRFTSVRNDPLVTGILDEAEDRLGR